MILEGIVTTLDADGRVNISPMGPSVSPEAPEISRLVLRPYRTSRTYRNLKRHGEGVFHVTDDVDLLARAAVGNAEAPLERARRVDGWLLTGACRFYEFRATEIDDRQERATIQADVVHAERRRDFLGFNRARHAVLEAAILATRTEFLPISEILAKLSELRVLVEKTGGEVERRAFAFLEAHIEGVRASRAEGEGAVP
jgi:hypothetical protein